MKEINFMKVLKMDVSKNFGPRLNFRVEIQKKAKFSRLQFRPPPLESEFFRCLNRIPRVILHLPYVGDGI